MKKILQGLFVLSMVILLTSCRKASSPVIIVIDDVTNTSLQVKSDYIISLVDEASEGYPMVNIANYALYNLTKQ